MCDATCEKLGPRNSLLQHLQELLEGGMDEGVERHYMDNMPLAVTTTSFPNLQAFQDRTKTWGCE